LLQTSPEASPEAADGEWSLRMAKRQGREATTDR